MERSLTTYENLNEYQSMEVQAGLEQGVDVSLYAKPEYLAIQMRQLRLGLEAGLDISEFSNPEYDWFQMEEIRLGMQAGIDYKLYAKPTVDYQRMRQIRKGLEDGIDLSSFIKLQAGILEELREALLAKVSIVEYIKEGYDVEQLTQIRKALVQGIDLRPYITTEFRGVSIREIRRGLEEGLSVTVYASLDYNWRQMREIRKGMETRVDISQYSNYLFTWKQMREIRLGLEDRLDVERYRKFIYTAADMKQIRKEMLLEEAREIVAREREAEQQIIDEKVSIFVSKDEMEACIQISGDIELTEEDILKKLKQSGISRGILTDRVARFVREKKQGQTVVIARGQEPKAGEDGWYEFFFDTNPSRSPHILEDGSADFRDVKWFELVSENQKVAYYHSAGFGVAGYTVTGKFLKPKKGREKSILRGNGFRMENDGKTYISLLDGKIVYDGGSHMEISRVCLMEDVTLATGDINFDGTVYVKGNIGTGVYVTATENVYVDGYVEAAAIQSGGEIFLRKGVNGNTSGLIEAKQNVVGQFFEEVKIVAGGDIIGQYCLNCDLSAEGSIVLQGKKGLLLGGKAKAAKGISAHCIGNRTGLKTVLSVGINQETVALQQRILQEIENINRELTILKHTQKEFQRKYTAEVRNTMAIYLKIENAIYTKNLQMKYWSEKQEQLEKHIQETKGAKIEVAGVLYEGTDVTIDNVKWKSFSVKDISLRCVNGRVVVESK